MNIMFDLQVLPDTPQDSISEILEKNLNWNWVAIWRNTNNRITSNNIQDSISEILERILLLGSNKYSISLVLLKILFPQVSCQVINKYIFLAVFISWEIVFCLYVSKKNFL